MTHQEDPREGELPSRRSRQEEERAWVESRRRTVAALRELAEEELTEAARLLASLSQTPSSASERAAAPDAPPILPPMRLRPLTPRPLTTPPPPTEVQLQEQRRRLGMARLRRVVAEEVLWLQEVLAMEVEGGRRTETQMVEVIHTTGERLLLEARLHIHTQGVEDHHAHLL